MIKTWKVRCQVNMCAEKEEIRYIQANTSLKAKKKMKDLLTKEGFSYINILSCELHI